jgi:hypothetical protein
MVVVLGGKQLRRQVALAAALILVSGAVVLTLV